ncbi:unnamed protein product [Ilex paraguariensis]|uniref:Uncharacterized protein n=1 Tax=Ilex paraguariensis TaxID=185542 RepID=A0ABC8SZ83_9AQUA
MKASFHGSESAEELRRQTKTGKAVPKVYRALRGIREGGYSDLQIGITTKFLGWSHGAPCLYALEVYSRSTHVVDWGKLIVDADGTFEEGLTRIMDSREQIL